MQLNRKNFKILSNTDKVELKIMTDPEITRIGIWIVIIIGGIALIKYLLKSFLLFICRRKWTYYTFWAVLIVLTIFYWPAIFAILFIWGSLNFFWDTEIDYDNQVKKHIISDAMKDAMKK